MQNEILAMQHSAGQELLDRLRPGETRLVLTPEPIPLLFDITWQCELRSGWHLLVSEWQNWPTRDSLLAGSLTSLREALAVHWPFWYGTDLSRLPEGDTHSLPDGANRLWLADARRAMASDPHRWKSHGFDLDTQQAAIALRGRGVLVFAVTIYETPSNESVLRTVETVADRLAFLMGAAFVVITGAPTESGSLSPALKRHFLSVADLQTLPRFRPALESAVHPEPVVSFFPGSGTPHPASPGEQLLAERMKADPAFEGLFRCNEAVTTCFGRSYCVDFAWLEGRLLVEVDGYRYHREPHAFFMDREKDYEFALSGFSTLRLTHTEVVEDVERALEKIRRMVSFRRQLNSQVPDSTQKNTP